MGGLAVLLWKQRAQGPQGVCQLRQGQDWRRGAYERHNYLGGAGLTDGSTQAIRVSASIPVTRASVKERGVMPAGRGDLSPTYLQGTTSTDGTGSARAARSTLAKAKSTSARGTNANGATPAEAGWNRSVGPYVSEAASQQEPDSTRNCHDEESGAAGPRRPTEQGGLL